MLAVLGKDPSSSSSSSSLSIPYPRGSLGHHRWLHNQFPPFSLFSTALWDLANCGRTGLTKTILQGTMKGRRRPGGHRNRWEDSTREWKSHIAFKNRLTSGQTGTEPLETGWVLWANSQDTFENRWTLLLNCGQTTAQSGHVISRNRHFLPAMVHWT